MENRTIWEKTTHNNLQLNQDGIQLIKEYRPGTVILCQKGVLWVTQSGDLEDYVLEPGKEFSSDQPGDVLIQAMQEASVIILSPEEIARSRSRLLHNN